MLLIFYNILLLRKLSELTYHYDIFVNAFHVINLTLSEFKEAFTCDGVAAGGLRMVEYDIHHFDI